MVFADRMDAGHQLAARLKSYRRRSDVVVLGLPRGGVAVAAVVADELDAPLDVFVVRKLEVPGYEELAMGAIASGGSIVLENDTIRALGIPVEDVVAVVERERAELERRERLYRDHRPPLDLRGRCVILTDDGLATGASMRSAVQGLRRQRPGQIVVAVPVAAPLSAAEFAHEVDDFVCLAQPEPFLAVGQWYEDFRQVDDDEVRQWLQQAAERMAAHPS